MPLRRTRCAQSAKCCRREDHKRIGGSCNASWECRLAANRLDHVAASRSYLGSYGANQEDRLLQSELSDERSEMVEQCLGGTDVSAKSASPLGMGPNIRGRI